MFDNTKKYEVQVLTANRTPMTEYYHPNNGQCAVEARHHSRFLLKIKNHTSSRIKAIPSVDGLAVIGREPAGPSSSGFLVYPFGETVIEGWLQDENTAADFVFTLSKGETVSVQEGKGAKNTGTIGFMIFEERAPSYSKTTFGDGGFWASGVTRGGPPQMYAESDGAAAPIRSMSLDSDAGAAAGQNRQWSTQTVSFNAESTPAAIMTFVTGSLANLRARGFNVDVDTTPVADPFPGYEGPKHYIAPGFRVQTYEGK